MNALSLILLASFIPAAPATPPSDPKKGESTANNDQTAIQGVWYMEAINYDKKVMDDDPRWKGATMEFTKDKAITTATTEKTESEYTLDSSSSPKRIDLIKKIKFMDDKIAPGIYRLEENKLTLCLTGPGTERPADFKPGEGRAVMVLKRKQPKDK
jgi:uncharacterized protein (TIGR03067 family)